MTAYQKPTAPFIRYVAKAIKQAGMDWLAKEDPKRQTLGWADVPDEVFAEAAIKAVRECTSTPSPEIPPPQNPS